MRYLESLCFGGTDDFRRILFLLAVEINPVVHCKTFSKKNHDQPIKTLKFNYPPIRKRLDLLRIGSFNDIVVLKFDENAGLVVFPFNDARLVRCWKLNNFAILLFGVELGVAESALWVDKAVFSEYL